MAWQEDSKPCGYFGPELAPFLRAVGWLERGCPFPTGEVDRRVYDKLTEFGVSPWQPMAVAGVHPCGICIYRGEAVGRNSLFIPGDGIIYVTPELITHYMNAHRYAPPAEFCRAVLACPPMRSMDYLKSLLANGGRPLVKWAGGQHSDEPIHPEWVDVRGR
jgi:hypothetical protein